MCNGGGDAGSIYYNCASYLFLFFLINATELTKMVD